MIPIDAYSQNSRLRYLYPGIKIGAFGLFMFISLVSDVSEILCFSLLLHFIGIIYYSKISLLKLLRLMVLPILFVMFSSISIAFEPNLPDAINSINLMGYNWGYSIESIEKAGFVFLRSFSAITILFFLMLNTSIYDLLYQFRKLKVPSVVLEISFLVYSNIFNFITTAQAIRTSQLSRLGYRNYRTSVRTFGTLLAQVFVLANVRANNHYQSMEARCFNGEFYFLTPQWQRNNGFVILSMVLASLLLVLNFIILK